MLSDIKQFDIKQLRFDYEHLHKDISGVDYAHHLMRLSNLEMKPGEVEYFLAKVAVSGFSIVANTIEAKSCISRTMQVIEAINSSKTAFNPSLFLELIATTVNEVLYHRKLMVEKSDGYDAFLNIKHLEPEENTYKERWLDFNKLYFFYLINNVPGFDLSNTRTRDGVNLFMIVFHSGYSTVEFLQWMQYIGADPSCTSSVHGGLGSFINASFVLSSPSSDLRWIDKIEYLRSLDVNFTERSPAGAYSVWNFANNDNIRRVIYRDIFEQIDDLLNEEDAEPNIKAVDYMNKLRNTMQAQAALPTLPIADRKPRSTF